ncbi:MAG: hypothetical protein IPJ19_19505 [Planctomycetes bacterium]|nr:hypothetical protein [Planctomycetota bacterium]
MMLLPLLLLLTASAATQKPPAAKAQWSQADLERVTEEIRGQVEELRGMKYKQPVAAKITDKKGFLEYARKRQEQTETPERRERDETDAKMLGLIPFGLDLSKTLESFLEGQVGGFYDPGTNTFYLMENFGGDLARIILSHELTHALDDQCFDLDKHIQGAGGDTDTEFAIQALAEGSGTNAMNVWTIQHMKELDKAALLASADIGTQGLDTAPTMIWKPLLAAYLRGEGFLLHMDSMNLFPKAAKNDDVRRAFEEPPLSSEQILHPKKYWDEATRDDPVHVVIDAKELPEGWTVLGQDTLGELYLGLLTQPFSERGGLDVASNPLAIMGVKYTNKAAEGWGGDRLVLLGKGDARALYLVTVWDTPQDATEFHDALAQITQRDDKPAEKLVSGPELERSNWLSGLSGLALDQDQERKAVTLRLEWKTKKGAEGLPAMLPWNVAN